MPRIKTNIITKNLKVKNDVEIDGNLNLSNEKQKFKINNQIQNKILKVQTASSSITITDAYIFDYLLYDGGDNTQDVTLPLLSTVLDGENVNVKNFDDSCNITFNCSGSDQLFGNDGTHKYYCIFW